jgi:hypothetical protein
MPSGLVITCASTSAPTATKSPFPKVTDVQAPTVTSRICQSMPSSLVIARFAPVEDTATNLPLP